MIDQINRLKSCTSSLRSPLASSTVPGQEGGRPDPSVGSTRTPPAGRRTASPRPGSGGRDRSGVGTLCLDLGQVRRETRRGSHSRGGRPAGAHAARTSPGAGPAPIQPRRLFLWLSSVPGPRPGLLGAPLPDLRPSLAESDRGIAQDPAGPTGWRTDDFVETDEERRLPVGAADTSEHRADSRRLGQLPAMRSARALMAASRSRRESRERLRRRARGMAWGERLLVV